MSKYNPHHFELGRVISKALIEILGNTSLLSPYFSSMVQRYVGNERDTYFWENKWVEDSSLCSLLSRLCYILSLKMCFVPSIFKSLGSYSCL